MDIHPDIRVFWARAYFRVSALCLTQYSLEEQLEKEGHVFWGVWREPSSFLEHIAILCKVPKEIFYWGHLHNMEAGFTYFWDGEIYSEDEMLRIIKLKAFL